MENNNQGTTQQEKDFLFTKNICCPVCKGIFGTRVVKSGSLRRLEPDFDLRPRFRNIDTLKYEAYSCPHCGYSAMARYFDGLVKWQIERIKEKVCSNFKPADSQVLETVDYQTAINRYKLALYNADVKQGKLSEQAYTCLKISWLYRSVAEEMPEGTAEEKAKKEEILKTQEAFYKKAFEAFQKVISTEEFPICGMDSYTMDYLLAAMACHFKEYSYASKAVSNILASRTVDRRMKDKALDLKEVIVKGLKEESEEQ